MIFWTFISVEYIHGKWRDIIWYITEKNCQCLRPVEVYGIKWSENE